MNKKELRKKYIEIRKNIDNKCNKDTEIFNEIVNSKEYQDSSLVLTYVSLNEEVDTTRLIEYSLKKGKQVAVPKCEENFIYFYYINSLEELQEGHFKVKEPKKLNKVVDFENSICIVPGICFDKYNNRVGFGKGYYDRFLQTYEGIKIGVTYKECVCDKIDTNEFDKKVDFIIKW